MDCDGNAVAGYNLYRRLSTEESYTRLNTAPITGLSYTDTGLSAAPAGATYYYALSAVDSSGEESVKSAAAGLTIADSGGGGGGGGGGACLITAAGSDHCADSLWWLVAMAAAAGLIKAIQSLNPVACSRNGRYFF